MSDERACVTPLLDLLDGIPEDARLCYEHSPTHHQMIPVGVYAQQAAQRVRELEAERSKQEAWHARAVASMDDASRAVGALCCDLIPERVDALRAENERLLVLLAEVVDCYDIDPTLRATIDAALAAPETGKRSHADR